MQTQVSVSNTTIRQQNGLYSLNDLHRASGGEDRHAPRRWLSNQQTIDLINQVEIDGKPSIIKKQQLGTFACEELVVHYGMWISPAFSLKVIRCFLDKEKASQKLTPEQKQKIQAAVNERHNRTGEHWQSIYKKLHAFCKVNSYHEIEGKDFQTALNYLASIQNAPEVLKESEQMGIVFDEKSIAAIAVIVSHAQRMSLFCEDLAPRLRAIQSPLAAQAYDWKEMPRGWICDSQRALMRALPLMKQKQYIESVHRSFERMM